ncbi:MAG: topoisomerase DNA-binding C4 zinc finger domain-containing protein, partial [Parcubacteria group bacterium]|nr:topoisomerase DNA-binding C4 zinc finger domain-containing protein [Parcubacteria group bacterium]
PEEAAQIKALEEKTKDERCPLCGKPMAVKRGRFGYFLGCSDYPTCKGIAKILEKTGFKCPKCLARQSSQSDSGPIGDIVLKKSRGRGKIFFACSKYPDCDFTMNKKPENEEDLKLALNTQKSKIKKTQ